MQKQNNDEKVQIEMSSQVLTTLLNSGLLHCGDCKSLNASAKSVLWHSLLASSISIDNNSPEPSYGDKILCA